MTTHIIALSGGKDSTALALALQLYEPRDYIVIANPTGNELPEMYEHLRNVEARLGLPVQRVGCGLSFEQLIYRERMIPNHWARFCTRVLKIEPTQEFLRQFDNPVLYVGLRADEESRGGANYGVECRFPFREWGWGLPEVRRFLREREMQIPRRTDCALCFFQRIDEWWSLWRHYPNYWRQGERIERDIGHTFRGNGDTWPAAMRNLRKSFERGHVPRKAPNRKKLTEMCSVCSM
jgi:hypothetical protein